jgi:hypothetical protein
MEAITTGGVLPERASVRPIPVDAPGAGTARASSTQRDGPTDESVSSGCWVPIANSMNGEPSSPVEGLPAPIGLPRGQPAPIEKSQPAWSSSAGRGNLATSLSCSPFTGGKHDHEGCKACGVGARAARSNPGDCRGPAPDQSLLPDPVDLPVCGVASSGLGSRDKHDLHGCW